METQSKGLEDAFLVEFAILVSVWEWRLSPAQGNQGEGYGDIAEYGSLCIYNYHEFQLQYTIYRGFP